MNCPVCSGESRVLTKDASDRRRECSRCGHRFTTVEMLKDDQKRLQGIAEAAQELSDRVRQAA